MISLSFKIFINAAGILIFLTFINGEKYICGVNTDVIFLQTDELVFVESPNFPRQLTMDERKKCRINFVFNVTENTLNKRLIFWPTNVICTDYDVDECPTDVVIKDNVTSFNLDMRDPTAFQGFILFDDWGLDESCPLESISRENPFHFADETEIIYLQSTFYPNETRKHSCLWQFSAPKDYGFKLVIHTLKISSTTKLSVWNSTDILLRENLAKANHPYYNNDKYLKIVLSGNIVPYINEIEFVAYVTIIKNKWNEIEDNCEIEVTDSGSIVWRNAQLYIDNYQNNKNDDDDINNGYPNNARCTYNLIIKPKTEILVLIHILIIEEYVDHLNYYINNNTDSIPTDLNTLENDGIVFTAAAAASDNDTEEEKEIILWEFISDGSWQSVGFKIEFQENVCECSDSKIIVPCYGSSPFTLMNIDNGYYCGNLNCNYTIKLDSFCSNKIFKLVIDLTGAGDDELENDLFDIFIFYSDNISQLEISHDTRDLAHYTLFLSSNTTNTFQVITVPAYILRTFNMEVSSLETPSLNFVVSLSAEIPYFFYNSQTHMNEDEDDDPPPILFSIEMSPQLISMGANILVYYLEEGKFNQDIQFFIDESFTFELHFNNCRKNDIQAMCETSLTKFFVYHFDCDECASIIFQSSSKNCVFKKNVYTFSNGEMPPIVAISKPNKIFPIFFQLDPNADFYYIKNMWASPTNKNLTIYAGDERKLLLQTISNDAHKWHDIHLTSPIYVIEIPSNTAIMFHIKLYSTAKNSIMNISSFPYQSLIVSPLYGINKGELDNFDNELASFNISEKYKTKFEIMELFVNPSKLQYYFIVNETKINITSKSQIKIFSNCQVYLFYECDQDCGYPFDILIYIETLENELLIEPLPTTMTTTRKNSKPDFTQPMLQTTLTSKSLSSTSQNISSVLLIFIIILKLVFVKSIYTSLLR